MSEQRDFCIATSGGVCEICGEPLTRYSGQMAHRIGNTEKNRKKYGNFVVDHKLNVAWTCSLGCNQKADISYNPVECAKLCKRIYEYEIGIRGM